MGLVVGRNLHLNTPVPDPVAAFPLQRVTDLRSFSRRNEAARRRLDRRVDRWRERFPVDADPVDLGDVISFLGEKTALEVFLPSDSVWWTDRTAAFAEAPPEARLPDEGEAVERARAMIDELEVGHEGLEVAAVTATRAALSRSPDDRAELVATGVTVTLGYALDGVPVVGPGARIRISFGGGGEPTEFARFWRHPSADRQVRLIHPYQAIERLANDERFADLSDSDLEVTLDGFRLAHFAAGPSVFQRFLIPVYEVRGRVEGGELENDVFLFFLTAVDADGATLKRNGATATPTYRTSFGGL